VLYATGVFCFKPTGVPVFLQNFKLHNAMRHFAMELVVLLICSGLHAGQSAKILAMLNVASPSHNIFNTALTIALAKRGHQVLYLAEFGSQ
jgi:hypothetical protein